MLGTNPGIFTFQSNLDTPLVQTLVDKPILMGKLIYITAYSQIVRWRSNGIAQADGKGNLHVCGNIEHALELLFDRGPAEDAHDLQANAQRLGHEPHVLHSSMSFSISFMTLSSQAYAKTEPDHPRACYSAASSRSRSAFRWLIFSLSAGLMDALSRNARPCSFVL
jgi:hypothetical protein